MDSPNKILSLNGKGRGARSFLLVSILLFSCVNFSHASRLIHTRLSHLSRMFHTHSSKKSRYAFVVKSLCAYWQRYDKKPILIKFLLSWKSIIPVITLFLTVYSPRSPPNVKSFSQSIELSD